MIATALFAPVALAQEPGPDALVRAVSRDVIAAIKGDRELKAGNEQKLVEIVARMVLPHVDTVRMTRLAMGASWRQATPTQQQRLAFEFTALLVYTYSGALASYSEQEMIVKPVRAQAGEAEVAVGSEIRRPGAQPVAVDYFMEKTPSGWKLYDIKIGGVSLVSTYRATFSETVRNHGIDGLIEMLSNKNRQNARRIAPVQA